MIKTMPHIYMRLKNYLKRLININSININNNIKIITLNVIYVQCNIKCNVYCNVNCKMVNECII